MHTTAHHRPNDGNQQLPHPLATNDAAEARVAQPLALPDSVSILHCRYMVIKGPRFWSMTYNETTRFSNACQFSSPFEGECRHISMERVHNVQTFPATKRPELGVTNLDSKSP